MISVRESQPVNLVGAYEEAIGSEHRIRTAAERLAAHAAAIDDAYGTAPVASWVVRVSDAGAALDALGTRTSLDGAVDSVGELVTARLAERV